MAETTQLGCRAASLPRITRKAPYSKGRIRPVVPGRYDRFMTPKPVRFNVGDIYLTNAISELFPGDSQEIIQALLTRHASGDWGDLNENDKTNNDTAARTGGQILSAYDTLVGDSRLRLWIITDAGHQTTTVLLPREY